MISHVSSAIGMLVLEVVNAMAKHILLLRSMDQELQLESSRVI